MAVMTQLYMQHNLYMISHDGQLTATICVSNNGVRTHHKSPEEFHEEFHFSEFFQNQSHFTYHLEFKNLEETGIKIPLTGHCTTPKFITIWMRRRHISLVVCTLEEYITCHSILFISK